MVKLLAGRCVVVTRPQDQAADLTHLLEAQGAEVFAFPVIDIASLDDPSPLQALGSSLATFSLAFFVSPNAVSHTLSTLPREVWPADLRVATVGPATAKALHAAGFEQVIVPTQRFDSEAVLDLPQFGTDAVRGRRILILRGDGGRELLADTLVERGAEVVAVACYQRRKSWRDPSPLFDAYRQHHLDALVFSSSEGVRFFAEISGETGRDMLKTLPVFAPHPRIVDALQQAGAHRASLTGMGDEGVLATLVEHLGRA
jgi:uroporphyrinogen-III synthase